MPAFIEVLSLVFRISGVIKNDPAPAVRDDQLKTDDRVDTGSPVCRPPRLDQSLARKDTKVRDDTSMKPEVKEKI